MTFKNLIKAVLFATISSIISSPLQILNNIYALKDEAPPALSFLIPIALIGMLMKTLYAMVCQRHRKHLEGKFKPDQEIGGSGQCRLRGSILWTLRRNLS